MVLAAVSQLMASLAIQQAARGWELGTPLYCSQDIILEALEQKAYFWGELFPSLQPLPPLREFHPAEDDP